MMNRLPGVLALLTLMAAPVGAEAREGSAAPPATVTRSAADRFRLMGLPRSRPVARWCADAGTAHPNYTTRMVTSTRHRPRSSRCVGHDSADGARQHLDHP